MANANPPETEPRDPASMSVRVFPQVEQVRQLPAQLSMSIPPQWEDRNGHVNVQYYLGLYELGGYEVLAQVGVGDACLAAQGVGLFDFEHHILYRAEILVGQRVSTYNRILGMNEKRFHGMYFIVNDTLDRLACSIEYITAAVDLQQRRSTVFPPAVFQGLQQQLAWHQQLDWPAPMCGSMRL